MGKRRRGRSWAALEQTLRRLGDVFIGPQLSLHNSTFRQFDISTFGRQLSSGLRSRVAPLDEQLKEIRRETERETRKRKTEKKTRKLSENLPNSNQEHFLLVPLEQQLLCTTWAPLGDSVRRCLASKFAPKVCTLRPISPQTSSGPVWIVSGPMVDFVLAFLAFLVLFSCFSTRNEPDH